MEYIEIKNWAKYQVDAKGVLREGPSPWIKDWTDKEADYEYSQLGMATRYLYDALRRLRGKLAKNPPNDPKYIARALSIAPKEAHCIPQSIRKLTSLGLITLVESAHTDSKNREEKNREEKSREEKDSENTGRSSPSEKGTQESQESLPKSKAFEIED